MKCVSEWDSQRSKKDDSRNSKQKDSDQNKNESSSGTTSLVDDVRRGLNKKIRLKKPIAEVIRNSRST